MIKLFKKMFFIMPIRLRIYVNHLYILFLAWYKGVFTRQVSSSKHDLSWNDFYQKIYRKRESYRGVFVQLPIMDWKTDLIQRPHHIAKAFAKKGWLVIYLTPNRQDRVSGVREVENNIYISNSYTRACHISGAVFSSYSTFDKDYVLVCMAKRNENTIVYEYMDCIDGDISGSNSIEGIRFKYIQMLSELSDVIIASSKALVEDVLAHKVTRHIEVGLVPNGVSSSFCIQTKFVPDELSEKISLFKKKYKICVGFTGAIAPWLWYEMINELVKNRPDVGFIFIGPDYSGGISHLQNSDNVLLTGRVPFEHLPKYCQYFDVCFIPFRPGPVAECTSPLKLFEYFALEKPVVVTEGMRECTQYDEVYSANSVKTFSDAINYAFESSNSPEYKAKLRMLADKNSWDNLVTQYEHYLNVLNKNKY